MKFTYLTSPLLISSISAQVYPTAIFHGFGDQCSNAGMKSFTKTIAEETGAYAECIEIGNGSSSSIFEDFQD